jgi:5-methylcytosine-specific restriction endonuclease McrA
MFYFWFQTKNEDFWTPFYFFQVRKHICAYCNKKLTDVSGTVDHIIPSSRWDEFVRKGRVRGKSANNWKNVVASCRPCNNRKDNKTPEEVGMKLRIKPFVPSKEYLLLRGINLKTFQTWDRWIQCGDDLLGEENA